MRVAVPKLYMPGSYIRLHRPEFDTWERDSEQTAFQRGRDPGRNAEWKANRKYLRGRVYMNLCDLVVLLCFS